MRERIRELIADPPPDWNGVYVAKEKWTRAIEGIADAAFDIVE
jgi:hypothetical protein